MTGAESKISAIGSEVWRVRRRSEVKSRKCSSVGMSFRNANATSWASFAPLEVRAESYQPPTRFSTWCVASVWVTMYRFRKPVSPFRSGKLQVYVDQNAGTVLKVSGTNCEIQLLGSEQHCRPTGPTAVKKPRVLQDGTRRWHMSPRSWKIQRLCQFLATCALGG